MEHTKLSRADASAAVTRLGWRYVLGEFRAEVLTGSLPDVEGHLRMDIRADRLLLSLQTAEQGWVTTHDAELARQLSGLAQEFRLTTQPGDRTVQVLELGIDALDIAKIRPFWKAVLGYTDEAEGQNALVDPLGQGPAVWFQQMDAPRPQRNRIHVDVSVPHDEAPRRIEATLAVGGTMLSDAAAPAFWVLADAEGNEACLCTWMSRD
jgi:4a-hydroxytetrahydrobiopterin dehydratase